MHRKPWYKVFAHRSSDEDEANIEVLGEATCHGAQLDNPIRRREDDALGRSELATSFAEHTLSLNPEQGVVVGVIGPWGSGKTSFINLARDNLNGRGVPVLDFNQWMFSGTEQLIEAFFKELAAQLRLKPELATLAERLEDYGDVFSKLGWVPFIGPWAARGKQVAAIIGKMTKAKQQGVPSLQTQATQTLLDSKFGQNLVMRKRPCRPESLSGRVRSLRHLRGDRLIVR